MSQFAPTANAAASADVPGTLPAWLSHQAYRRSRAVALRHKRLGVWQQRDWLAVHDEVAGLAAALAAAGFGPGDSLVLLSHPRPEALLLSLAAQWLGGEPLPLDPAAPAATVSTLLRAARSGWVFAEGAEEIARVVEAGIDTRLLIYADGRGVVAGDATRQAYADLLRHGGEIPPQRARAGQAAFVFMRLDAHGGVERQRIGHGELLREGQALIAAERLGPAEEAFAARAFAAGGQARYLLAPWLIAGFRLNFPENLATRDNDRRELGPTLVAGTRDTYRRLEQLVWAQLPEVGSPRRRLVDWALDPYLLPAASAPGVARRVLGYWLVRRPLRDVLGFTRTRSPLLVGEALPDASARFFAALGVEVRTWPDPAEWVDEQRAARPGTPPVDGWIAPVPLAQGA